jgi:hypothetical protein
MAGLQDITPIPSRFSVTRAVDAPSTRSGTGRLHPGMATADHDRRRSAHVSRETLLTSRCRRTKRSRPAPPPHRPARQRVKRPHGLSDFLGSPVPGDRAGRQNLVRLPKPSTPSTASLSVAADGIAVPPARHSLRQPARTASRSSSTPAPVRPETAALHPSVICLPSTTISSAPAPASSARLRSSDPDAKVRRLQPAAAPARPRSFRLDPRSPGCPAVSRSVTGKPPEIDPAPRSRLWSCPHLWR